MQPETTNRTSPLMETFEDAQPRSPGSRKVTDEELQRSDRRRRAASRNGAADHGDRLPPHSDEAEAGIIGSCLVAPKECLPIVMAEFGANDGVFYDLRNQTIYVHLCQMAALGFDGIDIITVMQRLKDYGLLDDIGGITYLNTLADAVISTANLTTYIAIVRDKFIIRKVIQVATESISAAYEWTGPGSDLLGKIERDVLAIGSKNLSAKSETVMELVLRAMSEIEAKMQSEKGTTGISTGFIDIDYFTDGLHKGELTVIAAYPGVGKTSLAMNIAEKVVLKAGLPVGIFSLEMSSVSLVKRCLCSCARVNLMRANKGKMEGTELERLVSASAKLGNAKIYFDDTSDLSIHTLRAKARRMWQQYDIKLFVVDYLHLLNASGGARKPDNREQEISDIANGMKQMAKELDVPVIVLSQLNDEGKLRESRAIGQHADNVWMLEENEQKEHVLVFKKQRSGPRDVVVRLTFRAEFTRFEDASSVSDNDVPAEYQQRFPDE
jgi:replicative DNA helicase